jgi:hypothetical protein
MKYLVSTLALMGIYIEYKEKYNIELKPDATSYHTSAFPLPFPKDHEVTLKLEGQCLCDLLVLKRVIMSEWTAPTFILYLKYKTYY